MTEFRDAAACAAAIAQREVQKRVWISAAARQVTFADLSQRIAQVAGLARDRSLAIGDRVVIATQDDCEAALLFASLVRNGLTVVQLDPAMGSHRATALIARADPALIIVDPGLRTRWELRDPDPRIIEMSGKAPRGAGLFAGLSRTRPTEGLAAVLDAVAPATPPAGIPPETLAYILFTSGTTFEPKGVSISHRALFSHLATLSRVFGYSPRSRILNTLMLSHADGMIQGPVIAFYNAATLHRPQAFEITTLDTLLDAVFQLRITHMVAVPTMLALMVRLAHHHEDAFRGGDFELLVSCGAALEPDLWEAFEQRFGVEILNVYGLTETVVGGVFAGPRAGVSRRGAIGVPIDCELEILDEAGAPAGPEAPGELLMRGPLLMSGYFADPALTAEVLKDGWLHTGDIARRDAEGHYWICGRKKNIVIRGGLNIHPEEIAEALNRHPAVAEAVAFGAPHPDWGETLFAVVASTTADEAALLTFCATVLEPRKVPSRIVVVDALPKGRSGKVILDEARALLARAETPVHLPSDQAEARLIALAARAFKVDPKRLKMSSTPSQVLGWDSLAHLQFIGDLEEAFAVRLTPRQIMDLTHLGKALDYIGGR